MARHLTGLSLDALRAASREMGTTALVVLDDGETVAEAGAVGRRIELMSVTKSVVSLIVGQLVDRKLLDLETPVADFVPAWKGTPKEAIRVVHILEHTSGLADKRTTEDIYAAGDFVKFAIDADLEHPPGERLFYSNRASNLLAPIVLQASGETLDAWARTHLFTPLGIDDFAWDTDRVGNVQVMAGLQMSARSLARLGQLIVCKGRVDGVQIVSEAWIERSTNVYVKGAPRGLLWWMEPELTEVGLTHDIFEQWRKSGVPEEFIAKFRHLEGQYFPLRLGKDPPFFTAVQEALIGRKEPVSDRKLKPFYRMTWMAGRPDGHIRRGPPRTVSANGWGGQFLIVAPRERIVVARLREVTSRRQAEEETSFQALVNQHLLGIEPRPPLSPLTVLLIKAARPVFRVLQPLLQRARRRR